MVKRYYVQPQRTVYGYTTEFAILKPTQQVNDKMDAMQCVLLGKLPIKLLNPVTLCNILKNVSLHLPEG